MHAPTPPMHSSTVAVEHPELDVPLEVKQGELHRVLLLASLLGGTSPLSEFPHPRSEFPCLHVSSLDV